MRKLLLIILALGAMMTASAQKQSLTYEGNVLMLKGNGSYDVKFDYSDLFVEGKQLDEFLASKDEKFRYDWESNIVVGAEQYGRAVPAFINKKFVYNPENPEYIFVIKLNSLMLGNAGAQFNPFGGAKAGGAVICGQIDIIQASTNEKVGALHFNELKGFASGFDFSDRARWQMAYVALGTAYKKMLKKIK
jgi:hypothetical protein